MPITASSRGLRAIEKEEGFFKALIPAEFGGGADYGEICHAIRRIAAIRRRDSARLVDALPPRRSRSMALAPSEPADKGSLKARRGGRSGPCVKQGFGLAEERGTATRTAGGYLINGRKIFSSGGPAGDLLVTSAVHDDPKEGPTVLHFPIPLKSKGVTLLDTWTSSGCVARGRMT